MAVASATKRKQRIVKNAYVDIDSVDIAPGNGFIHWIENTKKQLKERESKLLEVITTEIEVSVNKKIITDRNFIITEDIINNTLQQLYNKIDGWNGINLNRIKSSITRYRDYFCKSKNWWDTSKRKKFGEIFWLKVFKHIEKFVAVKSMQHFNIIKALFDESVEYNNTKPQPLINGGTVFYSSALHEYLFSLHNTLEIKQWIIEIELYPNDKQKMKTLINKIRHQLYAITANNVESATNAVNTNNHNNNNIVYGGYHGSSYSVSETRYAPIKSVRVGSDNVTQPQMNLQSINIKRPSLIFNNISKITTI